MTTGQFPLPTGQYPIPEVAPSLPPEGGEAAVGFVLRLGRALHAAGYPAHQLERALHGVAERLGLDAQFFSTPTSVFAAFGPLERQKTYLTRVEPGDQNLAQLARLDAVMRGVLAGELTALQGSVRVDAILAAAPPYSRTLTVAAFGLASSAVAALIGGSLADVLLSGVLGLCTGGLADRVGGHPRGRAIFEPLAAFAVALLAAIAAARIGTVTAGIATLAGLVVLLPGFMLTTAMTELATRHLASGTARLFGALITFLSIAFGVALATRAAAALLPPPVAAAPVPLPPVAAYAAIVVAALAFAVLLRAEPRDAGWIVAAGAVSFLATRLGGRFLGPELGAFAGALVIGVSSDVYARALSRPSAIPQVPGVLMIVPGSVGYRGLMSLLEDQVVVGIEAAFQMVLIGVSIVAGLLVSHVLVPPESFRPFARRRP